jgi:hypothetical protein
LNATELVLAGGKRNEPELNGIHTSGPMNRRVEVDAPTFV